MEVWGVEEVETSDVSLKAINELIEKIKANRDQKEKLDEQLSKLAREKGTLEVKLIEYLKDNGMTSFKGPHGQAIITKRKRVSQPATPEDKAAFFDYLKEVKLYDCIKTFKLAKSYTQIKLETDDVEDIKGLRSQIQTLGLQTVSPIDTVDQIDEVFKFFNVILAGFGAVGMVVAVLGMFNTLTISLLERTKEIGLMVALGGRDKDMRKLFVYEAVLLSLMGAIIGVIGSVALGQIVNLAMNIFAQQRGVTEGFQMFATPWWLVLGSLIFMVLIGLLVVFIPARRASRIDPIDALRRE